MLSSIKVGGVLGAMVVQLALAGAIVACSSSSSDSTSGGTTGEAGAETSTPEGGSGADAAEAGAVVVNACKTFVDRSATGAARTETWDFPISTVPERCMTIKVGQDVTFTGDFSMHPLLAGGGSSPNPFSNADTSMASAKITFPAAGTFGFMCGNHPSMIGAIQVEP